MSEHVAPDPIDPTSRTPRRGAAPILQTPETTRLKTEDTLETGRRKTERSPTTHPHLAELVERAKLRKKVGKAVSRLIAVLDELDTDPEAEPSLGAPENNPAVWRYGTHVTVDRSASQVRWATGNREDLEFGGDTVAQDDLEDDDPGGGDVLDERHDGDLGWHGNVDQSDLGSARDAELDPTDCIERYGRTRDNTKAHAREVEKQALAIQRRLSGEAPAADPLSNCRPLTDAEMARIFGRAP